MKIICISGKAQHGKDTTARMMKDVINGTGKSVLITHYGDLVKYICKMFFDWNGEKDEYGRHLLQHVGTDIVRKKSPTFWVDFLTEVLTMFNMTWDYVLIPDCRFPNEIECMKEAGFDVTHIHVKRTNFVSPLTPEQQAHPSETALDDAVPDIVVRNEGTLEDLEQSIQYLVKEIITQ